MAKTKNKTPEVRMSDVFTALDKQKERIAADLLAESDRFKALSKDYAHQALFATGDHDNSVKRAEEHNLRSSIYREAAAFVTKNA